jgi:hypothetical protein
MRSIGKLLPAPIIALLLLQISVRCPVHKQFSSGGRVAGQGTGVYCPAMILLRHGQSEFNLHFVATGRFRGRRSAFDRVRLCAGHLGAPKPRRRGGARIITSPSTRTLQNAAPIAAPRGQRWSNTIVRERYPTVGGIGQQVIVPGSG